MTVTKIAIIEQPIPYGKNGSWTQRLERFLFSKFNCVDYVICGYTKAKIETTAAVISVKQNSNPLLKKIISNYRYQNYIDQLDILINRYDHCIIMVVDNLKLKEAISIYLDKNKLKGAVSLLFYNCGFSYFLNQTEHQQFSKNLDEIVFLTKSAYNFNKNYYNEFTPEVTILNNPINKSEFYKVSPKEKQELIATHHLTNKKVFLWLSHDRPKKGLSLILNAWKTWSIDKKDVVLLIVGANREEKINNVKFIGQVSSKEVHIYYKLAHVYLFPTLWQEGFGLSLSQAVCSGCFCIAADNGGVSEFFSTQDGILESQPNVLINWVRNMEIAYKKILSGWENKNAGHQILDIEEWSLQFAQIFNKWEQRFKS